MIKKNYQIVFSTMIWIFSYSHYTQANLTEQCMSLVPIYTKPIMKGDSNNSPVHIAAKYMTGEYPYFIEYKGNVNIQQGNQTITADEIKLIQTETTNKKPLRTVIATGNVKYDDPQIILKGPIVRLNINNKDIDVEKGDYLMVGRQGRGYANKIKLRDKNHYIILEDGMFTTCPLNNDSWDIVGSKFVLDYEEQVAKIWNARFHIYNLPIFYSPYLQVPIGNKRRSGLLLPNISYSKGSGFNLSLPFYWNIAHNYDVTITPKFITLRGIKLNNEFRYLTIAGSGRVAADWIRHDRGYIKGKNSSKHHVRDNNNRWLLYWNHSGVFNKVWRFNIDYTKVSDSRYFTDFASKYSSSTDSYVTQKFYVGYAQQNWNAHLTHKQFQVFVDLPNSKTYKTEPQLDIYYYKYNLGMFNLKTYAQATRITSVGANNPNALRLHIEPELHLPLSNNWININNIIKVMATYYNQDIATSMTNNKLKKKVIRILPLFTSNAKLVFERDISINSNYLQTLEPWVQYLYVPYCDQSNINNYDSSLLQVDYNGLFRNRIYSGLDRIASANQLTTGITTRIYDEELTEYFNFSIGQIYFFKPSITEDLNVLIENKNNTGSLLWVGDAYLRLTDNLGIRGGLRYNRLLGDITMGNIITEYRLDSDHLIQLNYRFIDYDYIQTTVNNPTIYQKGISQIGAVVSWPLGNHWSFAGSYFHDMKANQSVSHVISLQYNTCCWSINMSYEHKIMGWQQQNFINDYDNRWSINIALKGLNNNPNLVTHDLLTSNILPYQRAF